MSLQYGGLRQAAGSNQTAVLMSFIKGAASSPAGVGVIWRAIVIGCAGAIEDWAVLMVWQVEK